MQSGAGALWFWGEGGNPSRFSFPPLILPQPHRAGSGAPSCFPRQHLVPASRPGAQGQLWLCFSCPQGRFCATNPLLWGKAALSIPLWCRIPPKRPSKKKKSDFARKFTYLLELAGGGSTPPTVPKPKVLLPAPGGFGVVSGAGGGWWWWWRAGGSFGSWLRISGPWSRVRVLGCKSRERAGWGSEGAASCGGCVCVWGGCAKTSRAST